MAGEVCLCQVKGQHAFYTIFEACDEIDGWLRVRGWVKPERRSGSQIEWVRSCNRRCGEGRMKIRSEVKVDGGQDENETKDCKGSGRNANRD